MTRKSLAPALHDYVEQTVKSHLQQLDNEKPVNLHHFVITAAESALLKTVLAHTDNNQSKAADYLGISRSTLRKKLKELHLQ